MDPRLVQYYHQELQFIREMGGEFAKQFTKIAGRLGMDGFEVADPYVERLLEGFAFLSARIQLKLDDEFPKFSKHLLEMVYPHYLSPTPSMAVVQLTPNLREGSLAAGVPIPRGASLRSLIGKEEQTACEYRTGHEVTLWPIEISSAEYRTFLGGLDDLPQDELGKAKGIFRLRLRATAGLNFNALSLDRLPIFLRGDDQVTSRLYEQLLGHSVSMWVRQKDRWLRCGEAGPVRPVGFEEDEALLPHSPRSFEGYRLLHEYFAFPERFMFVELMGLAPAVKQCNTDELEIMILSDEADPMLEGTLEENLGLYCVPVINLFPRRADRIHLSDTEHEYHVVPDRTRPLDFEIYNVTKVVGHGTAEQAKLEFTPFYAYRDRSDEQAFYAVRREQRRLSERQRRKGARSSYVGSEVFVSLVDGEEGPFRSGLKQLALEVTCTNRDLPLHMPQGQGSTDFTLESGAPVASIRCFAGPTTPKPSYAHGDATWRLISHLSLNYLSITDNKDGEGAALRELLMLYSDLGEANTRKLIESVQSVSSSSVVRHLPTRGPLAYARGVQVNVRCDESGFQGASVFLLGAVLERFLAKYASINSFTETVLETIQRGEVMRWPARVGRTPML